MRSKSVFAIVLSIVMGIVSVPVVPVNSGVALAAGPSLSAKTLTVRVGKDQDHKSQGKENNHKRRKNRQSNHQGKNIHYRKKDKNALLQGDCEAEAVDLSCLRQSK